MIFAATSNRPDSNALMAAEAVSAVESDRDAVVIGKCPVFSRFIAATTLKKSCARSYHGLNRRAWVRYKGLASKAAGPWKRTRQIVDNAAAIERFAMRVFP